MDGDHGCAAQRTAEIMRRFNDAFRNHRPENLPPLVAEDCVVENGVPAPDGSRHVGRAACVALWQGIAADKEAHFELEDVEIRQDRAVIRWRCRRGESAADSMHGVNLMRVRGGLIVEAMDYAKGK